MDKLERHREINPERTESPLYPKTQPGFIFGLHILVRPDEVDDIAQGLVRGFHRRKNIRLADKGVFRKAGFGFISLEWIECEIDSTYLIMLQEEEKFIDYLVYVRSLKSDEEIETYLDVRKMTRKIEESKE